MSAIRPSDPRARRPTDAEFAAARAEASAHLDPPGDAPGPLATWIETPLGPMLAVADDEVWAALREIPSGATRSYAQVAARIGRPTATRAVAAANGANPIALLIPCHRVIGADGTLTGYGGGLWRKRALLAHEAPLAPARPRQEQLPL